ncbi:hypothetical protein CLU79DRAFT_746456 [Phycomyces nitens]|nr:hypothetical protein CLU79DRAFT_746456 [Phycomyces nitens]
MQNPARLSQASNSSSLSSYPSLDRNPQLSETTVDDDESCYMPLDITGDSDADKDLVIMSLYESLHIHKKFLGSFHLQQEKELLARQEHEHDELHTTKDALLETQKQKETADNELEEQRQKYEELEQSYQALAQEHNLQKEEFKKMEKNFYSYMRSVRATDDDLSTIQSEFTHISSQLNNMCMSLKASVDRTKATAFVFARWPDKRGIMEEHMLKDKDQGLETSFLTLLTEKYLFESLLAEILNQPVHLGISINDAFRQLSDWIRPRNPEWTLRLRQQLSALVVKQADDEQPAIVAAMSQLVDSIMSGLGQMYPSVQNDSRHRAKIETMVARAAQLNLAIKGQDIDIGSVPVADGAVFDSTLMKAAGRGKPQGNVLLVISPLFMAHDPKDSEHGFLIRAKVFCV